jgi:hypothetical protein
MAAMRIVVWQNMLLSHIENRFIVEGLTKKLPRRTVVIH